MAACDLSGYRLQSLQDLVVGDLARMASPANLDRWVPLEQEPLAEVDYPRIGLTIASPGTDLSERRAGEGLFE